MANNISRQQGRMHTHTHTDKGAHTHFLSLPAIMEITVYLILNRSEDLIVSKRFKVSRQLKKKAERRMCVPECAIKAASGGGGLEVGGGINIGLFWTLLLFYSVTLFHTHGGPAHFLTNPISHSAARTSHCNYL